MRDRDRPLAGELELVAEHLVERLAGARRAGLADEEVRMTRGCDGDAVASIGSIFFCAWSVVPFMSHVTMRGAAVLGDLVAVAVVER